MRLPQNVDLDDTVAFHNTRHPDRLGRLLDDLPESEVEFVPLPLSWTRHMQRGTRKRRSA